MYVLLAEIALLFIRPRRCQFLHHIFCNISNARVFFINKPKDSMMLNAVTFVTAYDTFYFNESNNIL